ncbi:CoA transferase [Actinacidiphila sp. DG2A-62]|uniref:CaiB/BaiF CoA transferase family protein n=1 Tax=Actinacidiphila sp. DG2A-62 TaxID=3108821 RepID=UPI002DBFD402|nr:CoA transferase [Actinacidiphila sp. DG2A-62]MEC3993745.1 CoA transferase [Actinacidiphila sp. DG2A-62]
MTGPLDGIVVVDLTRALSGPYATMLLADLGADVIKVESPAGDSSRSTGPFPRDDETRHYGGYFQSVNRNKRSVVVDLRAPEGAAAVRRLAAGADVLVENFRAGIMDRMGLSYESLRRDNPRLVYGALRGFGDPRTGAGPHADRPAFDVVAQAMGGLMGITGPADQPTKVGPGIGDIFPAALLAVGVLAALTGRARTGRGRFVDVAMYDAIVSLCERTVYQHSYTGAVPTGEGNDHPLLCPFGLYRTADGWVTIAAPRDHQWQTLCTALDRPDLAKDPLYATNNARVAVRDKVRSVIEEWTTRHTSAQVVAAVAADVPCGPVNTAADLYADPHLRVREMLVDLEHPGSAQTVTVAGQPIKFAGSGTVVHRRAPLLGEHTAEILGPGAPAGRDR